MLWINLTGSILALPQWDAIVDLWVTWITQRCFCCKQKEAQDDGTEKNRYDELRCERQWCCDQATERHNKKWKDEPWDDLELVEGSRAAVLAHDFLLKKNNATPKNPIEPASRWANLKIDLFNILVNRIILLNIYIFLFQIWFWENQIQDSLITKRKKKTYVPILTQSSGTNF